ncbi:coenzyme F390 synthetase [soil metagenome]
MTTCLHASESDALHARVRALIAAFENGSAMPESFDVLAAAIARYQGKHVAGYQRLLAARGVDGARIARAVDAPAVPTDAFKLTRISAFPATETTVTFRTSGTTLGQRGSHAFRNTGTYDRAAESFARHALLDGMKTPLPVLVVGPSPRALPDSSLTHMFGLFVSRFGTNGETRSFFIDDDVIDLAALDERVARAINEQTPVLVCGTSFAFVHLLDGADGVTFRLPRGSRLMQTGGFKGKSREVDASEFARELARFFALDEADVRSEYGMTELSSQCYGRCGGARVYVEPPWARGGPVDPITLAPVADGEIGIARIEDLANVDSAFAIVNQDRVRRVSGGFELLGRTPGAPPRGCSIAIDEMLS